MLKESAFAAAGYFLGSIPSAYLVTKVTIGKDIRLEGNGNVGTRNVLRVAGVGPALVTLALDVGKGFVAYRMALRWGSGVVSLHFTGLALMLGHCFPLWLRGRGGKGLAVLVGFLLPLWPWSVVTAALLLLVVRALVANSNVPFAVAGVALAGLTLLEGNDLRGLLFVILVTAIAGAKKVLDAPYETVVQRRSGWTQGPHGIRRIDSGRNE